MNGPRVLFANHTGELAGAEHSLLDLLDALSARVSPTVACPEGELADMVRGRGVEVRAIPGTSVSFRPHPIHTPRGLAQMAHTGLVLRGLARRVRADLVHANTERAGLSAILAGARGGPPTVVHTRARFPDNRLGAATGRALARGASAIVANSRYTAMQFPSALRRSTVEVIHNPIDCRRFDPGVVDRGTTRAALSLDADDPVLAVVGYLAPVKCQDDAIRILAGLKLHHPRVRLLVAGGTRFTAASARVDSAAYERDLRRLADDLGLQRDVMFLGERDDVRDLLGAIDLLLVPSEHEGFGRVALEGMAMEVPVIATSVGGTSEIIHDGVEGMLLEPRSPDRWTQAAAELLSDPDRRRAMGASGRKRALREFSLETFADRILSVYDRVLGSRRRSTA